jgi:hypothetical protein
VVAKLPQHIDASFVSTAIQNVLDLPYHCSVKLMGELIYG